MGPRHQPKQVFSEFGGDDFQVFKHVPRRDFNGVGPRRQRLKLYGCILHLLPVLVAPEVGSRQDRGTNHVGIDDIASQQSEEDFRRFHENLTPKGGPRCLLDRGSGDDAVGSCHEFKPACGETHVQAPLFIGIEAVKAEKIGHAFRLSDGAARCKNGYHGAADFDVLGSPERFQCKLWEIGAQPHLALPVRNHRVRVGLLGLGRQMRLRNPANSKTEFVGTGKLLEVISQHRGLVRNVAVLVGCL